MTSRPNVAPRIAALPGFALLLLVLATPAFGQTGSSTIQGLVKDTSGAILPNAHVVALNTQTGVKYEADTNASGFYRLSPVERGVYRVTITAPNLAEWSVDNVAVAANDVRDVEAVLKVAGVSSDVSVTAEAPITDTATSEVSSRIGAQQMRDMPLNGRDFTRLALLTPGVVATYSNLSSMTFNGINSELSGNNFLLDGTDATNVENSRPSAAQERGPRLQTGSIEGLEEFKVSAGTYSAEQGRAAGSVVQITSKSGTNQFSGSAFEFYRNERFDARNFFSPSTKLPFDLNQFGGALGGPIAKDRTFFFANYEGSRQAVGITGVGTAPPASALTDLAAILRPIANTFPPTTTLLNPTTGQVLRTGNGTTDEDVFAAKIDHNLSAADRFYGRYSYNNAKVGGPAFALFNNYLGTDQEQNSIFRSQFFNVGHTHVFSSAIVNEARFGVNAKNYDVNNGGDSQFPQVNIGGYQMTVGGLATSKTSSNSIEIVDKLSWVRGRHAIRFGLDMRRPESTSENNGFYSVRYANLAAFLVNSASSATILPVQVPRTFSNWNTGTFVQDDWRVRDHLTLNLGLRYDYNTVLTERDGQASNYIGGTGPNLVGGTYAAIGSELYAPDRNNWGPRAGFAYDLGGGRTVVRGGFGLFYSPSVISTSQTALSNPPGPGVYVLSGTASSPLGIPLPDPTAGPGLPRRPVAIQPDLKDGYTRQYSANVQQQFGARTVVQVGYLGYQGRDLLRFRNIDELQKPALTRPDPRFSGILYYESAGKAQYNALLVSLNRRFSKGMLYGVSYTLGHLKDDIPTTSAPQNPLDMAAEWGDGDSDVRHNLSTNFSYELPLARWFSPGRLTEGWQFNALYLLRSGLPLDVKLGYDSFGNNSFNERPDLVGDPTDTRVVGNKLFINPSAYQEPAAGSYGNAPRNSARGPSFNQLDMSLFKNTRLSGSHQLQLRWEVFNVFNTANFSNFFVGTTLTSGRPGTINPSFGVASQTFGRTVGLGTSRQMQFAVKYLF